MDALIAQFNAKFSVAFTEALINTYITILRRDGEAKLRNSIMYGIVAIMPLTEDEGNTIYHAIVNLDPAIQSITL